MADFVFKLPTGDPYKLDDTDAGPQPHKGTVKVVDVSHIMRALDRGMSVREAWDASDRLIRAEEVAETYVITPVGPRAYVVIHPEVIDDPGPGRSYLVDMTTRICACPDWQCRHEEVGDGFACKHILSVEILEDRGLSPAA